MDSGFSAALGPVNSGVNLAFPIAANRLSRWLYRVGLW
jgi:hypothetical protein